MTEAGFVKLHRKLLSWEWYTDINVKTLFIHLLLTVNFEDARWRGIEVKRGSRIASTPKLAEETGLTEKQVRTALDKLIRTGEVARSTTSKYSLISVKRYDEYQSEGRQTGSQRADRGQTKGRQRAGKGQQYKNNKEEKERKEEKEDLNMTDMIDPARARGREIAEMVESGVPMHEAVKMFLDSNGGRF